MSLSENLFLCYKTIPVLWNNDCDVTAVHVFRKLCFCYESCVYVMKTMLVSLSSIYVLKAMLGL
jgi:hypothetical protein